MILGLHLLFAGLPTEAQQKTPGRPLPHRVEGVQVGYPVVGKQLFQKKGCVSCHAIKSEGGAGPRQDPAHP